MLRQHFNNNHNPDVLTCIANLSNDEVFTPPKIASAMLDLVAQAWAEDHDGDNLWENPDVKFLDPFVKTGIFLREITRRLTKGLEHKIPDLQERVNHILTKQVYGIAITELTALMARRTIYCSKYANSKHSICTAFDTDHGNIWFERTEHTWTGGTRERRIDPVTGEEFFVHTHRRCSYCKASEDDYGRGDDLETHAYALTHTEDPQALIQQIYGGKDMHFDVIIGNPPYQLSTSGHGKQARPIYGDFVQQAKKLDPRYLTMIIPSRWFAGGMGLDEFRNEMLHDGRIRVLADYLTASDVFPGVGLKGGVCYFLWNRDHVGECQITTRYKDSFDSSATRELLEPGANIFIRFNEGVSILRKVAKKEGSSDGSVNIPEAKKFINLVSSIGAFGLESSFKGRANRKTGDLKVYRNGGIGYISRDELPRTSDVIDSWKLFIGRAAPGTGNKDTYPHRVISTPFLGEPGSVSSWTYMHIGPFETKEEAQSVLSYLKCRFTRFLIQLHKASQDTTRKVYTFVPQQSWDRIWTDEELYAKYGLSDEEIAFIESIVRPMEDD
ncbi:Eco57I restriction-modification methylase domain-containing protein [Corynebacterium choanae]|uniref:site-specific DNA-methyltransferase (adenine-specific) n=1 Tax=Corynebacterium choanae TaxID=1862358 RepID=A0A3G6J6Z6_9CORY|nr:Eco57I restriction-modification methylase domain-containing protein [Corynebacterium choanae]AZA13885.1 Eco57I restriction-modification methylase [Corynebacterium choanae]